MPGLIFSCSNFRVCSSNHEVLMTDDALFCLSLELVFGVKVRVCGDLKKLQGPCLIIMNHRTRLDWMFFWCYLIRMGDLRKLKIMLKAGLKNIPVAGECFPFTQIIGQMLELRHGF